MHNLSQATVFGPTSSLSAARKLCLLVLLSVFVLQLGRVFIVMEACSHHKSTGYTLQHCKDAVGSIVRTPVLAEGVPPATLVPVLEPQGENSPYRLDIREDAPRTPLFHPPRKAAPSA